MSEQKKGKVIQTRIGNKEIKDLRTCRDYFGFANDSQLTRFLIVRTADNIRSGKPLSILVKQ